MQQVHLKLLTCLVLLTTSVTGQSTVSDSGPNSIPPPIILGQSSMSAWGGFSPPGAFIPQLSSISVLGGAPPALPTGLALPPFDINYALSFYGVSNINSAGLLPYPFGRKKRSTTERKKRFLPGGLGPPVPGFILPGDLPGPFLTPPLIEPIVPPMIPPIAPLPPPTFIPPIPYPMIAPFSLASPLIRPIVPPIPVPLSGVFGGFLDGALGGPLGIPRGGPFGAVPSEPFFENPFDTDFGLGGGFRFSNEYDGSAPDAYLEPFPFPGGYDTYGKYLEKAKKKKENEAKTKYNNYKYGKSYANSYADSSSSKKSYGNSYSNDYGRRKENKQRKYGNSYSKSKYNGNGYDYSEKREYGSNVAQQRG